MWSIWPGIGFGNWTGCPKLGLSKNREHMVRRGTGNIWVKGSKMLEGRAKSDWVTETLQVKECLTSLAVLESPKNKGEMGANKPLSAFSVCLISTVSSNTPEWAVGVGGDGHAIMSDFKVSSETATLTATQTALVAHAYNPSSPEAEVGRWRQVGAQSGQHSKLQSG